MLRGCDPKRVTQDARAAVRRGPEADDLGREIHRPVVAVAGAVIQSDVDSHWNRALLNRNAHILPGSLRRFERKEGFVNSGTDGIHLGLKIIEKLVQTP